MGRPSWPLPGVEGITIGETITSVENPSSATAHPDRDSRQIAMTFTINRLAFFGARWPVSHLCNLAIALTKELPPNVLDSRGKGRRSPTHSR